MHRNNPEVDDWNHQHYRSMIFGINEPWKQQSGVFIWQEVRSVWNNIRSVFIFYVLLVRSVFFLLPQLVSHELLDICAEALMQIPDQSCCSRLRTLRSSGISSSGTPPHPPSTPRPSRSPRAQNTCAGSDCGGRHSNADTGGVTHSAHWYSQHTHWDRCSVPSKWRRCVWNKRMCAWTSCISHWGWAACLRSP